MEKVYLDLVKIAEWKNIIEYKLMPKIIECDEILEGNIYSLNTKTDYYNYFFK